MIWKITDDWEGRIIKIHVDITHPAHVHFFKHPIWIWLKRGHQVIITSRDKDLTIYLLDSYGFPHYNLGHCGTTPFSLAWELFNRSIKLLRIVRKENPDIMISIAGTFIAPVGRLIRTPVITFYDTEHDTISNLIAYSLSQKVVLPSCYNKPLKHSYLTYNGYHGLSYLHPNYFSPDPTVLNLLGLKQGNKFVIMRFVSWKSGHDIGHSGLSLDMKRKAVKMFSEYAKVFISSEKKLPRDLEKYKIHIPPERMHDALYYATLLYGESSTMASECAILGTPAIFIFNGELGYSEEQEKAYGAIFNFSESYEDQKKSIIKGVEILQSEKIKDRWEVKRNRILSDKINVTNFVVDLVENSV